MNFPNFLVCLFFVNSILLYYIFHMNYLKGIIHGVETRRRGATPESSALGTTAWSHVV